MEFDVAQLTSLALSYLPKVIGALLTLIIGFWIAGMITRFVRKRLEKNSPDPTVVSFIASLVNIGLKVLVLLSVAGMFGVEVTSFIAILGALAFAIGMALQGNLSHMASGLMILFFKPFKVNDFIVTQGYSGTVKEIQIFNTILTTLDNRVIIVPNGAITSGPIENLTTNSHRKVPMVFGISYVADIDNARQVIQKVADSCPHIDHSQPVDIFVTELADSSVNFAVRPWCETEKYWDVYFYMHENVKKAFDNADIGIPFPQMDLHIDNPASLS